MGIPPQFAREFPARIAFIGDQPGPTDMDRHIPLSGSSGNVFNAMLRTANLDRYDFHITNVFDEPIENAFEVGAKNDLPQFGSLGYLRPEFHHHLNRLKLELADSKPRVIVPLGDLALWALTGSAGIASQRGSIQPARYLAPGAKLLPTYHPSFVIKQWKYFSVVTADIIRANREGDFRDIRLPKRELVIEPSISDIRAYLPRLLASDLLSVDIETGWGMVTNIGFAPDSEHAINIPLSDIRQPNRSFYSLADEIEAWKLITEIMTSDVPKLGQNFGGYDAYWFIDNMGIAPRNFSHDTRLIHHALYPELPKDLEFMGGSYSEQGAWKAWGRKSQEKRES